MIRARTYTRTAVVLALSREAYTEIRAKLIAAGYGHAVGAGSIDMDSIAVRAECPLCGANHTPTECRGGRSS